MSAETTTPAGDQSRPGGVAQAAPLESRASGSDPEPERLDDMLRRWVKDEDGGPVAVILHREWTNPVVVAYFAVEGEPQSKARARVTTKNGRATAYTPRQTQAAEETIGWQFRAAGGRGPDATKTFGVFAVFRCGRRQRRDVDNMLKLLLDGLNKVAWADDSQVTEVSARLVRGVPPEDVRTDVIVYETVAVMTGGLEATKRCENCSKPFRVYPSTTFKRFCGNDCVNAAKRLTPRRACKACGKEFQPSGEGHVCCSAACSKAVHLDHRLCTTCAKPITTAKSLNRKFCSVACHAEWRRGRTRVGLAPVTIQEATDVQLP